MTYTGFREAAWTLTSTYPLGIFVGIGAFSSFTRALAGSPLLTIFQTVCTEGRVLVVAEAEVMSKLMKGGDLQRGGVVYGSTAPWIIIQ